MTNASRPQMLQPAEHVRIAAELIGAPNLRETLAQIRHEIAEGMFVLFYGSGTQRGSQQPDAGTQSLLQRMGRRSHTNCGCSSLAICATARVYSAKTSCGVS